MSPDNVGLAASAAAIAAIAATVPAGRLVDRVSPRAVLLACDLVRVVVFGFLPLADATSSYFLVVSLAAVAEAVARPAQMRLLFILAPAEERVGARASIRTAFNSGAAVGALVASVPLAIDRPVALQAIVGINVISFVAAAALTGTLPRARLPEPGPGTPEPVSDGKRGWRMLVRFAALALSSGVVVGVGSGVLEVGVPLQVTHNTAAPTWMISGVFLLNTVIAVGAQKRASRGVDSEQSGTRANRVAGALLAAGCMLIPCSAFFGAIPASSILVVVAVLLTASEVLAASASWALAYSIARDEHQGQDVALFGLIAQIAAAIMPAAASFSVTAGPPAWFGIAGASCAAGLLGPALASRPRRSGSVPASFEEKA
jgi:MFS family permease